jgi:sulfate adenylyltransferase large subunit
MATLPAQVVDFEHFVQQTVNKQLLRFFTAGNVDDGKSTLIGRLLFDSRAILEDHLADMRKPSATEGVAAIDFALLTDGLRAEREQGITIDVAYRFFSTPKRQFIIADTPGHEQYTRNMATGASTASLAVILIDACNGVLPQSRRHAFIASLLGVNHMVVAINKMDLVDFSEERFEEIRADFSSFAAPLQIKDICFIPISALHGDNVVNRSERMPWYSGPHLLGHLESVYIASDQNFTEMRLPVQYVIRAANNFRGYAGSLSSGVLRVGDEVMVLPSRVTTRVKAIHSQIGDIEEAVAPMAVTVSLAEEVDVSRGAMLVHPVHAPRVSRTIDARLVWMNEKPLDTTRWYLVKHTSQTVRAQVASVRYRMNFHTLEKETANQLNLNDVGAVTLICHRPLFCDPYKRNPATGNFILIDPVSNETVGAGMITGIQPDEIVFTGAEGRRQAVTREEQIIRRGHKPAILWVGDDELLSDTLERALFERGCSVHALHEMIEPRNLPQLLRVLNAAGLITIWSSSVTSRDELEQAVKTSGTAAFLAVDKIGTEKQAAVRNICEVLEKEEILVRPDARETD